MSTSTPARLLTLPDIAALAGVQRPVPSMWRTRTSVRGETIPFPVAVDVINSVEYFAMDDVVAYLAATGRGRNPEYALDAPTMASPVDAGHTSAEMLLTLALVTGEDLARADLVALATEVDPDDAFLLGEVRDGGWPADLAGHIDELVAASLGPEDALNRLDGSRLARQVGDRGCTPELVDLVTSVATAGRKDAVLDPTGDKRLDRALAPHFAAVLSDDRRLRRQAAILGWAVTTGETTSPVVRVRSLLGRPRDDVLDALDKLAVGLGPGDVAVALGPAATMTDALTGQAEKLRAMTVRPGPLAAVLRLPRGMWRTAHRQSAAIWVLTGGAGRRDVRLADLDDGAALDLTDLSADIAQALAPMGSGRTEARAYRYLRSGEREGVLAGGPLVPRGARAQHLLVEDGLLDRAHAAAAVLSEPLPEVTTAVTAGHGRMVVSLVSLGQLVAAKRLTLRQGRRIAPTDADLTGTVHVLTADGALDAVRLDPFDARARSGGWTEPGDVVFLERPQPRAMVDTRGGNLVATPSRILRLAENAPVSAHILAARINQARPGTEWQTWEVPALPRAEAQALSTRLAEVTRYRTELRRKEQALTAWADALVRGVAAGSLAVPDTTTTLENR
ncbi:hypothetical protein [Klenkia brasiliensis]|uniref:Uncharacterized protein n=1 Tax=Klenkia brasiliensis TaxID=333142 RepID=A0A1G8A0H7_9ACTN|nr:hypothetical protein [Klenkia brasiliensis]SDH14403.1 hypothetical protein SAMN05660324_0002 [Klenkia brasiliensis]